MTISLNHKSVPGKLDSNNQARLVNSTTIRFSEIISALSVSLDITQGHPEGHSMRSCLIGMRLSSELTLSSQERAALFYALLLKDLGCSSNAAKIAYLFAGDDHSIKHSIRLMDWTNFGQCLSHCWKHCNPGASSLTKLGQVFKILRTGPETGRSLARVRCERGAEIAKMIHLSDETAQAIRDMDEHWNGGGNPYGLKGDEISLLGRICGLAQCAEVFFSEHGLNSAYEVINKRSGKWFEPALVETFNSFRDDQIFWRELGSSDLVSTLGKWEPSDKILFADEEGIDLIAEAFAQVVDAKSPWTFLHSSRVADISVGIANQFGLSNEMTRDIRRVALLHDIGKLGVSNKILDKPSKPTDEEFAEIKKHPEFSYRILDQIEAFKTLANVAGAHHERLDGKGYFRGINGSQIDLATRIITVADICEALTAQRPYREALDWERTQEIMSRDVGKGIDADCYSALVAWYDRHAIGSRVEQQLNEVECLLSSLGS